MAQITHEIKRKTWRNKNSNFEVYTKLGHFPSKNTAEKLKSLQSKDEYINAINSKNLGNVDAIIEEYKSLFEGTGKLKDFELTIHIDKSENSLC